MSICAGVASRTLRGRNCQRQNYGRRSIHRRRNNNNRRMPDDAVIKIKLIGLPARALAAESFEGDDCTAVGVFCALLHIMHCLFCTLSLFLLSLAVSLSSLVLPVPPFETYILYAKCGPIHVCYTYNLSFSSLVTLRDDSRVSEISATRIHAIFVTISIRSRDNIHHSKCSSNSWNKNLKVQKFLYYLVFCHYLIKKCLKWVLSKIEIIENKTRHSSEATSALST